MFRVNRSCCLMSTIDLVKIGFHLLTNLDEMAKMTCFNKMEIKLSVNK